MAKYVLLALLTLVAIGFADVPHLLNIQGLLTDNSGEPLADGTYSITFAIYADESGGSALWTETRSVVTSSGLFTIYLGESNPIPPEHFDGTPLWLGIKVGTDAEMTPRTSLTSVGYAYRSLVADSAITAGAVVGSGGGWVDNGDKVYLEATADSVGIGTNSPQAKLHLEGTLQVGHSGDGHSVRFYGDAPHYGVYWDPVHGAFRAGKEIEDYPWDDADITGEGSFAAGYELIARNRGSIALGRYCSSLGDAAIALGDSSKATQQGSVAIGHSALADLHAKYSAAIGHNASAWYPNSFAFGQNVAANDTCSFVIGVGPSKTSPLVNNTTYSLVVGFESQQPTLFVDGSSVGIGTTSTDDMLHVENNGSGGSAFLRIETSHASNWGECGMRFKTPDNTWHLRMDDDSHNNLPAVGSLALRSQNSGKEVMTWTDAGYVGINQTNPTAALHVVGSICYTGSIGACSDARYKESIETIDGALDKVSQMRGVEYNWRIAEYPENHFSDKRQVGFLAQELLEVLPEVVDQGSDGYYTVDYAKLTPLLVEAIKELRAQNQQLQTANENLIERLVRLESLAGIAQQATSEE